MRYEVPAAVGSFWSSFWSDDRSRPPALLATDIHEICSLQMIASAALTSCEIESLDAFCTSPSDFHHESSLFSALTALEYRWTFCCVSLNSAQLVITVAAAVTAATDVSCSYRARTEATMPSTRIAARSTNARRL